MKIILEIFKVFYYLTLFSLSQSFDHCTLLGFGLLVLQVTNSLGIVWILKEKIQLIVHRESAYTVALPSC